MECIRFLARQRLAFRANDGNDNLTQLFKLLNKNDSTLLTRLDKESHLEPGQHKYMHNDIQNELIKLIYLLLFVIYLMLTFLTYK